MKEFNCFITLLTSASSDKLVFNLLKEGTQIKPIGSSFCLEQADTIGACLSCRLSFHNKHKWVKKDTISVRDELVELTNRLNIKAFSIIVVEVGPAISWHSSNVNRKEEAAGSPYRDASDPESRL